MKAAAKGWKDAEMKCLGDQKRQEDAGKKKKRSAEVQEMWHAHFNCSIHYDHAL